MGNAQVGARHIWCVDMYLASWRHRQFLAGTYRGEER